MKKKRIPNFKIRRRRKPKQPEWFKPGYIKTDGAWLSGEDYLMDWKQYAESIKWKVPLVDVIGLFIPLKRAGANFLALCPFHKEKTPSFAVNPKMNVFYCFGCHKGGDVFQFVQECTKATYPEAVRRVAKLIPATCLAGTSPSRDKA